MEEVRGDGRVLLQPASAGIEGVWRGQTSGTIITISGDTGVYTRFGSNSALMQDAVSKGQITIGGEVRTTGNLGTGQVMRVTPRANRDREWLASVSIFYLNPDAPNVITRRANSTNTVITLSPDGRTLTVIPGSSRNDLTFIDTTYTRQ